MDQAEPSRQLSSHVSPCAAMLKDNHEFFFELDCFLQCVNEYDFDSKGFDPRVTATSAASGGYLNAGSGELSDETLRDEEVSEVLLSGGGVGMLGASSISTSEFTQQPGPAMSKHYLGNSGDDFGMWQHHLNIDEPMATSNHQLQPEDISFGVPTQQGIKQAYQAIIPAPKVPKPKNKNLSRKRQREELVHLRVSVQELQLQLETLLSRDASEGVEDHTTAGRSSQRKKEKLLALLAQTLAWKRAASDEKIQSEQAAAENMRLRALVDGNLQICKNLREACSKSGVSRVLYGGFKYDRVAMKKPTAFNTVSDAAIFASLREGLDAKFQQVGAVWAACDFSSCSIEAKGPIRLRSDADGGVYLEHTQSHVFPFTADLVGRSIWKLMKSGLLTSTMGELKVCRVMGNTLYATFADTIPISSSKSSSIKVWIALKRFVDAPQVVMVFHGLVEIEHSERVIQVTESGWNVVQSIVRADVNKKKQSSLNTAPCASQTSIHSSPGQNCEVGEDEFADGSPTATALNQFHDNMGLLNQTIENFLLDESLASRSGGGSAGRCDDFPTRLTRYDEKSETVA